MPVVFIYLVEWNLVQGFCSSSSCFTSFCIGLLILLIYVAITNIEKRMEKKRKTVRIHFPSNVNTTVDPLTTLTRIIAPPVGGKLPQKYEESN